MNQLFDIWQPTQTINVIPINIYIITNDYHQTVMTITLVDIELALSHN